MHELCQAVCKAAFNTLAVLPDVSICAGVICGLEGRLEHAISLPSGMAAEYGVRSAQHVLTLTQAVELSWQLPHVLTIAQNPHPIHAATCQSMARDAPLLIYISVPQASSEPFRLMSSGKQDSPHALLEPPCQWPW